MDLNTIIFTWKGQEDKQPGYPISPRPEKKTRELEERAKMLFAFGSLGSGKQFPAEKDGLLGDRVVQFFARGEAHTALGWHLNLRAGLWVHAGTSRRRLHRERPEANQANLFTGFERVADGIQRLIHHIRGFLVALTSLSGYPPDQLGLANTTCHEALPPFTNTNGFVILTPYSSKIGIGFQAAGPLQSWHRRRV
jgi:hypothetical protein